jgi:hypothetical protein
METKLTEQQSLEVISEMINRARTNIQKGSANNMIYNGYAVALVAIANFILLYFLPAADRNWSYMVWWLMIPSSCINHFIKRKIGRSGIVKTQIDGIIHSIWRGFSISVVILLITLFSVAFVFQEWSPTYLITPGIMILVAIAEFILAKACRYKPFFWGAVYFWIGALLCTFTYCVLKRGDLHFLILAVCMIAGFVIPGYMLNKLAEKHV